VLGVEVCDVVRGSEGVGRQFRVDGLVLHFAGGYLFVLLICLVESLD